MINNINYKLMLVFMSLAYLFSYLYDFTEIPFIFFVSLAFFVLAIVFFIIYLLWSIYVLFIRVFAQYLNHLGVL